MRALSVRRRGIMMALAPAVVGLWCGPASADILSGPPAAPPPLDAQVVWEIKLPSSQTMSFRSYHLIEGRIYAMGTDGTVIAVRADTGQVAWMRALADENDALWPPVAYHTQEKDAVVFTRLDDVVLVDPKTGVPIQTLRLSKPSIHPVSVAPGRVFVVQANGRLAAYRLRDGYIFWRAAFNDQFTVPPAYAAAINAVVAIDSVGLVAGLRNEHRLDSETKRVLFKQNLRSAPAGPMSMDGDMLYLTTANQTLHAIDMGRDADSNAGDIVWQYRLVRPPMGGPLLSASSIYQLTHAGGLHRIAKNYGEFKNWFDPQGVAMLAEWPAGVVVLRDDDTVALVGSDPAWPLAVSGADGFTDGLSNTVNDAIFLTAPDGTIRCIRPSQGAPLQLASFLSKGAAPAEPDEPTEIDRLREAARKKRDKLAGRTPPVEPTVPAAPAEAATPADGQAEAVPAEPYDPLRSKRPVVR